MKDRLTGHGAEDDRDAGAASGVPELSALLLQLLGGVLYRDEDERLWESLLQLREEVIAQAGPLLLDLVVDETEGYAFLKAQADPGEDGDAAQLPRLFTQRPLNYAVSLTLALLRRQLAQSDAHGSGTRLVLTRDEIAQLLREFLPPGPNEAGLVERMDATIASCVELGFLRRLKPAVRSAYAARQETPAYEVRRILKAFVDAQWLADFDARLELYRTALSGAWPSPDTPRA